MRFVSSGKLVGLNGRVRPPGRTKVQSTPCRNPRTGEFEINILMYIDFGVNANSSPT